ncbi:MAG: FAD-binding oxidoreductase [Eubacteriales bacterium]|nr:FAD-binding oxidoreductase [Eubacteriales bacterium]
MAKKPNLKSVNRLRFLHNNDERKARIEAASETPLPMEFPVNALSRTLHPDRQFVTISQIKTWDGNCKSFTFVPDPSRGTTQLAFFKAGSYLSVFLEVNGAKLTRPYSISSSPQEALEGKYTLTIKRVPGGIASNYMLDNWKVGDKVTITGPLGEFVYLPVRDGSTVIGVAGGSGITPFHSFAKAIADGDEDFNLILLYGSRTEKDILFKDDFDALEKQSEKIKVVHVLSDETKEGFEHGFITAELIRKYAPERDYSIFLCGPAGMYRFLDQQIETLHLEPKWVRHELQGELHAPKTLTDYPKDRSVPSLVRITVRICDEEKTIIASTENTILQSLEKNGIAAPAHCRSGECGWCHSLPMSGEVYCPKQMEHRREADLAFGYVHPCCTFPLTDIQIEVPYAK